MKNLFLIVLMFCSAARATDIVESVGVIKPTEKYGITVSVIDDLGPVFTIDVSDAEMCIVQNVEIALFDGGSLSIFNSKLHPDKGVYKFQITRSYAEKSWLAIDCNAEENRGVYSRYHLYLRDWL